MMQFQTKTYGKSHAAIPGKENRSNRSNFEVYKSHAAIPGKENSS
jgi:hypothetical protein